MLGRRPAPAFRPAMRESSPGPSASVPADVPKLIDHALLRPNLTTAELDAGCRLALAYDVASVCILPYAVRRCAGLLSGGTVRTSTVIGFPHGGQAAAVKRAEALEALADGCEELDVVVNISRVVSDDWAGVADELAGVIAVAHQSGRKVKVIFETCYLDEPRKIRLCRICSDLGADWVKTSTGFAPAGATEADVRLMREHSAAGVQVKASGGIGDLAAVLRYRDLGATRIGTSRTAAILDPWRAEAGLPPVVSESGTADQGATSRY